MPLIQCFPSHNVKVFFVLINVGMLSRRRYWVAKQINVVVVVDTLIVAAYL